MKRFRVRWIVIILVALAVGLGVRFFLEPGPEPGNITLIEPGFYMGGCRALVPSGVRAVLNLSMNADTNSAEVSRWEPIEDGEPVPTVAWLRSQVEFIDQQRKVGRAVFVHCDAGVSRSGLVSAAYFMWRDHLKREDALAFLRRRRPEVKPNPAFMNLLAEWETSLGLSAGQKTAAERRENG
jgi:predicted protein tyrosine phosphatase